MQFLDSKIKSSFFDDEEYSNFQLWKKGTALKKPSEVRIFEGNLFKRSSRTNFWKSRYYVLFEDRLVYYKSGREDCEKAYCLIQNVRIEKISNESENDEKYGIRLIHNLRYCDLYVRSKDHYYKWISVLSSFGVLSSYSTQFVNMKVIGKGSFAKVYLSRRKSDNAELAVKTFDKNLLLKQDKARSSLISEINIMRQMKHENIIKLSEVYESDNHIYLVQELLNGGELFDRIIKKGQYSEKDACILMKKLLGALSFMHAKGVMHRDIKPENLILKDVENDWNVKIADFGLATYVNPNHDYLFKRCGTPGYVAPEVLADQKYDQKVDVFSAGVILYILLTGGSPFYGKSYNEILWKNKVCEVSFEFKEKGTNVSESAVDLLKRMLAKDPARRISAAEALEHDWIVLGGMGNSLSAGSPQYLCSAQENMKRFQEENRFNVKNIKPKDLDRSDLERCVHAPSPLINGKVISIIDSPDLRRTSMGSNKSKLIENMSPCLSSSPSGFHQYSSPSSTIDESDDFDAISDEHNTILENIGKYRNGYNLISQIKDNSSSNSSSSQNTPVIFMRPYEGQGASKKAMNVQENLLDYVKTPISQALEQHKKTSTIKDNLRQLH